MQDLTGLRRDVDERDDANFFSRDAVERQRDLTRPHLHHAHVGALGECELDFGGVEMNRPRGRREGVGDTTGNVARQRAEFQNLSAFAGNLDPDLGGLREQRAPRRELHVEGHVETRRDGLLQLHRDVEHQREKQRRALDRPVAHDPLEHARAHSPSSRRISISLTGSSQFAAPMTRFTITPSRSMM